MERGSRGNKGQVADSVEALLSLALSGNYLYSYYPAEKKMLACAFRRDLIAYLSAPIKEKVFAWTSHPMRNLFHNHHPSPITFHIPLQTFRFLGPLERHSNFRGRVSRVKKECRLLGSDPIRSTPPRIRVFGLDRQ
ncbi:hypothetical protein OIU85_010094 [Salix viminalis]|uniref:Uncharacterized protein n=1 Tax=Salix viminalis TaxID=40686 RepID=A0A9Q0SHD5_SALVM|nr:hypothetical protein OIU85_010094 [Salix viminalis]